MIEKLKALEAESSIGPWKFKKAMDSADIDEVWAIYDGHHLKHDECGLALMANDQYYPSVPENEADWRFIVALRNLAPELIALWDAAHGTSGAQSGMEWMANIDKALMDLHAKAAEVLK